MLVCCCEQIHPLICASISTGWLAVAAESASQGLICEIILPASLQVQLAGVSDLRTGSTRKAQQIK
jgi:hypothetical protein